MRAARLYAYDENISPGSLKVEEVEEEPGVTGPFDVVVRIGGAGLCRTDIHVIEGQWKPLIDPNYTLLPYVLGHENAGWVHEMGSVVTNVEVGDAVIVRPLITCGLCRACRAGDDMHCENQSFPGITIEGGLRRPSEDERPGGLEAARGRRAGGRRRRRRAYCLPRGQKGAADPAPRDAGGGHRRRGGLSHIGIQSLKALTAAKIIVVDPLEEALSLAKEWGADHTVKVDGGHVDTILEMTDGQGAEAVIDFVGEKGATSDGFAMTRRAGNYYVIGYGENINVPTIDIISTERSFVGNLVGTYNDLAELMTLQARGLVTLHTSGYPLDAVNEAIADLDAGRLQGRGILVP